MREILILTAVVAGVLNGCGSSMTMERFVDPTRAGAAESIPIYWSDSPQPDAEHSLAWVEGYACHSTAKDPRDDRAAQLQARLQALDIGATAIIAAKAERYKADFGDGCGKGVKVRGMAVLLAARP